MTQGKISWQAPVESFQVEPQHNIESDHPIITEAAAEVAGGAGRNEARKLYEFTAGLLAWPEENRRFIDASALKAFTSGIGSCGEFANLMVALCRASNIPSQTVIGLLFPDMGPFTTAPVRPLNHPGQSHAWVEYYSGGRWEMADPSCSACNEDWLPFGWSDGRHLSYGEVNQLATTFGQTRDWAEENGQMIGNMFGSLKFVATAESEAAMVTPRATMRKGWDGRWLNLMLCWTVTMLLLQRWNLRRVRAVRGAIDAAKERELSRQTLPPGFAGEAAIAA